MNNPKLLAVKSKDANEDELKYFHSSTYVDFLKRAQELDDSADFENEELEYGLNYDCPILENMYDFVKTVGGSSLTAAKVLNLRKCKVAINWFGGWHHAQRYGFFFLLGLPKCRIVICFIEYCPLTFGLLTVFVFF